MIRKCCPHSACSTCNRLGFGRVHCSKKCSQITCVVKQPMQKILPHDTDGIHAGRSLMSCFRKLTRYVLNTKKCQNIVPPFELRLKLHCNNYGIVVVWKGISVQSHFLVVTQPQLIKPFLKQNLFHVAKIIIQRQVLRKAKCKI